MKQYTYAAGPLKVSFLIPISLIITYVLCALNQNFLDYLDSFITPAINLLQYIGIPLTHLFMVSHSKLFTDSFLRNLIGIATYGVLITNLYYLLTTLINIKKIFSLQITQAVMKDRISQMGKLKYLKVHKLGVVFLVILCFILTVMFLNGIEGWMIFNVRDKFTACIWVILWYFIPSNMLVIWYLTLLQTLFFLYVFLNKEPT